MTQEENYSHGQGRPSCHEAVKYAENLTADGRKHGGGTLINERAERREGMTVNAGTAMPAPSASTEHDMSIGKN